MEIVEAPGAFEHIYETADVSGVDWKYHLADGYVVDMVSGELTLNAQHETVRPFESAPEPLHEYMPAHLKATESLSG